MLEKSKGATEGTNEVWVRSMILGGYVECNADDGGGGVVNS